MNAARELDFAVAGFKLNERIAKYQRQRYAAEIGEAADALRARQLAESADIERRRWRRLVLAGAERCVSCGESIAPWDRWVVDGVGPEHARCCIDGRRSVSAGAGAGGHTDQRG
jgi:hypothetical protein